MVQSVNSEQEMSVMQGKRIQEQNVNELGKTNGRNTCKKKKIGKEENLTFYANCFFSQYNVLLYVNMTCLPNVIYFLENFLRRN